MIARLRLELTREWDVWRLAFMGLRASPLRTVTVLIASAWGIMFLVFLHSVLHDLRQANAELIITSACS